MAQQIDIRRTTPAEPAAVWRLLGDSFTWPSWTPIEWVIVDRHADQQGLGEMRTIKIGRSRVREEIIERQVESALSYKLSSGRLLRHYHVDIDLTPLPEGTEIRWYDRHVDGPRLGMAVPQGTQEAHAAVR